MWNSSVFSEQSTNVFTKVSISWCTEWGIMIGYIRRRPLGMNSIATIDHISENLISYSNSYT